jgi:hypothetical protein
VIASAIDVVCQTHALGNIVPETPEVDDIAAGAQRGCTLDQGGSNPAALSQKASVGLFQVFCEASSSIIALDYVVDRLCMVTPSS